MVGHLAFSFYQELLPDYPYPNQLEDLMFDPITVSGKTFARIEDGVYSNTANTFSSPSEDLRITGYTKNRDNTFSGSTSYVLEKDVVVAGKTVRKTMRIVVQGTLTTDFTAAEFQNGLAVISAHHTGAGRTDMQLQGRS